MHSRAISVPRSLTKGHVYFVSCDRPDFPIKIGFTVDPKMRIMNIGQGLPYPLIVLATIKATRADERVILLHFRKHRLRGEWFERSPAIMEAIERAKAGRWVLPPSDPVSIEIERHLNEVRKMDFSEVAS